jgi:hypothetical protein
MAGKKQRALPVIEQIKIQLETKPFCAFVVESSGGNLIPVSRPEWVFFVLPSGAKPASDFY